jgi:hypothetical protein
MSRLTPPLEIYDFETQIETAMGLAAINHDFKDVNKQGDDGILLTPRIESKFVCGEQVQRSYVQSATVSYPNFWRGTHYTRIVTSRKKKIQDHRMLRSLVRWIWMQHDVELSPDMPYLSVVRAWETGTANSFEQTNDENISVIAHSVDFVIKPSAFPVNT